MRSEQGESAFSDCMQRGVSALGISYRDSDSKVGKTFFAKTYLIVLKHEENLFWKKLKIFWLGKFLASIGTLVSQWDTQAPAPCHAIRTGRVRLLWLHAKGSFCLWDLIAIPGLWFKSRKIFFSLKLISLSWNMKKTCFEKSWKFFDLENFWPRLVLLYRNETPKLRPLAMRSEQGESAFSDNMRRGVSAFGISYRDSDSKVGKTFFAKTYLIVLKHEENLFWKKLKIFWLGKFLASIGTLVSQWDTQAPAPCHAIRTGRVRLLWLHAKGSFCLWDLIAIPGLWFKSRKIFFSLKLISLSWNMKKTCFEKSWKFFDLENFWPRLVLLYRNETPKLRPLAMRSEQGESAFSDNMRRGVCAFGISLRYRDSDSKVGKTFFAKTYLIVLKHEENLFWKKVEIFWLRKFLASIGTLVSQWDTQARAPCHAIRIGRVRLLWLHAKGSFGLWDLIAIPGLWFKSRKIFFSLKLISLSWNTKKTCFETKLKKFLT